MRTPLLRSLIAIFLCAIVSNLLAGDLKSEFIAADGHLEINIPRDVFLKIRTFTQDGGTERGVVSVTTDKGPVNVLSATLIDTDASNPLEPTNNFIIAGPATVTVTAGTRQPSSATRKKKTRTKRHRPLRSSRAEPRHRNLISGEFA